MLPSTSGDHLRVAFSITMLLTVFWTCLHWTNRMHERYYTRMHVLDAALGDDKASFHRQPGSSVTLTNGPSNTVANHGRTVSFTMKAPARESSKGLPPVKSIHLIGERHSGTTWISKHLRDCFNNSVQVSQHLSRWKHWFQYEDGMPAFREVYVVALFRNPYEWVEAMRFRPHYAVSHNDLDWKTFVERPWSMPRYGQDLLMDRNKSLRVCQQEFTWREAIPCLEGASIRRSNPKLHPLYELHPATGRPYRSIVELRRDKIFNFLSIRDMKGVEHFWTVQYEAMVKNGTKPLIRALERELGIVAKCQQIKPQPHRKQRSLSKSYVKWMNNNVDWKAESLIGYYPISSSFTD